VHNAQLTSFVDALFFVYYAMIIAWIVLSMLQLPYSRPLAAVRSFLDQTVAPFINLFRRYVPPLGPLDLSPLFAFVSLTILRFLLRKIGI
jgi:uncharacterized protein YggT (Ycf19 family)